MRSTGLLCLSLYVDLIHLCAPGINHIEIHPMFRALACSTRKVTSIWCGTVRAAAASVSIGRYRSMCLLIKHFSLVKKVSNSYHGRTAVWRYLDGTFR